MRMVRFGKALMDVIRTGVAPTANVALGPAAGKLLPEVSVAVPAGMEIPKLQRCHRFPCSARCH